MESDSHTIESVLHDNARLQEAITHLEDRMRKFDQTMMRKFDQTMNALSPAVDEIKLENKSLTAMIWYCINEFPSSRASIYLKDVMDRRKENKTGASPITQQ